LVTRGGLSVVSCRVIRNGKLNAAFSQRRGRQTCEIPPVWKLPVTPESNKLKARRHS